MPESVPVSLVFLQIFSWKTRLVAWQGFVDLHCLITAVYRAALLEELNCWFLVACSNRRGGSSLPLVHFREVLHCREFLVLVAVKIGLGRRERGPSSVEEQTSLRLQFKSFARMQNCLAMQFNRNFLLMASVLLAALWKFTYVCSIDLRLLMIRRQESASL